MWLLEDGAGVTGRGTYSGQETLVRPTGEREAPARGCLSLATNTLPPDGAAHLRTQWRGLQTSSGTSASLPAFPLINNQIFVIHPPLPDSDSWGVSHVHARFRSQVLKPC